MDPLRTNANVVRLFLLGINFKYLLFNLQIKKSIISASPPRGVPMYDGRSMHMHAKSIWKLKKETTRTVQRQRAKEKENGKSKRSKSLG